MKISVIVPVYNVEPYLVECIDSVINQSFRDFEIILVDDGSTDNSGKICERFEQEYPEFIVVIRQKNQGVFAARIAGINKACGDIFVFLDSDDTLRKDALEVIYKTFYKYSCDMLFYDAGVCQNYSSRVVCNFIDDNVVYEQASIKKLYMKLITYKIPNSVCLKAIRRERVCIPVRFKNYYQVKHGEDLLMSVYFISRCKKVLYIKQDLYYYRIRSGSAVHSFDIDRKESIKIVHTGIENHIEELGLLELKPLHNARKVRGWAENLILLLKNKDYVDQEEFKVQLKSMAEDEYFLKAYGNMDASKLSFLHRILACCLVLKQFSIIYMFIEVWKLMRKIKSGIVYVRKS